MDPMMRHGLEERQALHELVRISHNRAEDLRLLYSVFERPSTVWREEHQLREEVTEKMIEECSLREEWRVQRETDLVAALEKFEFATCGDTESRELADKLLAMQQVQDEERRIYEERRAAKPRGRRSRASPVQGKSLGMYSQSSSRPKTSSGRFGSNGLVVFGSPGKSSGSLRSSQRLPASLTASSSPQRPQRPQQRPGTAPLQPQRRSQEPARQSQLLHMQRNLRIGLRDFKLAEGLSAAHAALQGNVQDGHSHFVQCMEDLKDGLAEVEHMSQRREERAGRSRTAWDKQVWTGQLGHTRGDLIAAEAFRQRRAARIIQRALRQRLLPVLRGRRAAERAEQRRRDWAAVMIQAQARGRAGRHRAKELQQHREESRRRRRVAAAKEKTAAIRIQMCWLEWCERRWRKDIVRRSEQRRADERRQEALKWQRRMQRNVAELEKRRGDLPWKAATTIQRCVRMFLARTQARDRRRAIIRIQAATRGWLARRSIRLWWRRSVRQLRLRRARAARWQEHRRAMMRTHEVEGRLLGVWMASTREVGRASEAISEEVRGFEAAWARHVKGVQAAAFRAPLPRNWVPQMDPLTTRTTYLNTRTGEVHSLHPNMHGHKAQLDAQRLAGEAQLRQRVERLQSYGLGVRRAAADQQQDLYQTLRGLRRGE